MTCSMYRIHFIYIHNNDTHEGEREKKNDMDEPTSKGYKRLFMNITRIK